jgi:hypothetical protein
MANTTASGLSNPALAGEQWLDPFKLTIAVLFILVLFTFPAISAASLATDPISNCIRAPQDIIAWEETECLFLTSSRFLNLY